jgi:hypothetical protein
MNQLRLMIALVTTAACITPTSARADFFDMNNNGIPDFVDPTSAAYWTTGAGGCNTHFGGGGSGGGGGPMSPGEWTVIAGVSLMVLSPVLVVVCDDPNVGDSFVTYHSDSAVVEILKELRDFGKWYSAQVWCGTKNSAKAVRDWVAPKKRE